METVYKDIVLAVIGILQVVSTTILVYIIGRIDTVYTRTAKHAVRLENHESRISRTEEHCGITPRPTQELEL